MQNEQETSQLQQGLAALAANDFPSALAWLLPLAEAGNAEAQAHVGSLYVNSLYRLPKPEAEEEWSRLSKEQLARWEEQDTPEAIKWLTKASEQGFGPATHNLAMLVWSRLRTRSEEEAEAAAKVLLKKAWAQGCRIFAFSEEDIQEWRTAET